MKATFHVTPKDLVMDCNGITTIFKEKEVADICNVLAASFPDLMRQALTRIEQTRVCQNSYHGVGTPGGLR